MNIKISNGGQKAVIASALLIGLLSACGGGGADDAPVVKATMSCAQIAQMQIPASSIGLRTTGAVITATQPIAASGTGASAVGDYCLVSGSIRPVDPTAPEIHFQVALPATWNSKVLMMGGGGFDGTIPNVIGGIPNTTPTALTPLGLGFAVFGSDSGHQSSADLSATGLDASFALNQEALMNWVGDALKKTHDAALLVVAAAYGSSPSQSYFVGASTGGREALAVASRWPADWDGVVSLYPARDATTILGLINMSEAFAAPGAYLDSAKRGVLYSAALAACDALDGVSDGVISNVQGCNAIFNPATATLNGIPVQCPGGTDTGDTCLSAAQLSALDTVNSPISFGFSLATGETGFPGFNAYISDAGIPSTSPYESYVSLLGFGFAPPAFPVTASMALSAGFSDQFVRFIVAGNAGFDYLTFNATNPGAYASRVSEFAGWLDDTDLTAFAAKGGKLLLMHGTADMLISPRASELYYQRLQANMGADNVNTFLRFYEVPGFSHELSTTFNVAWDSLTALENWVEQGIDPASNQVVIDTLGVPGRTRPLCIYPTWPKYSGSGDVNSAASFTCAQY